MECYLINDDSVVEVKRDEWSAQTFTPVSDHRGWFLQYKAYATPATTRVRIELQETTGGEPNGSVLAWSSRRLDTITPYSPGKIANDTFFLGCDLKKDVLYALVMRPETMRWVDKVYWRYDAGDATYPRGHRLHSTDEGASWTHHANDCLMFAVWGDPPAPPPPPSPPKDNFAILSVKQEDTGTGIKFLVATNVPCHLFMLWTSQNPEKHTTPILRRGALWKNAIRFCFVDWNENEQEEEGYTLYHTFTKEPWAVCETRWFTFRAKIEDNWSPSVGPIFKKHRVAPPQEVTFQAIEEDGYLATWRGHPYQTWEQNWASSWGTVATTETHMTIYNYGIGTGASIYRGVILIDTSALPADAQIIAVTLHILTYDNANGCNTNLCITPATNVHVPMVVTDYAALKQTSEILAAINIDDLPDGDWLHWELPEAVFEHINKGGITRLGVRTENEINGFKCQAPYEMVNINTHEHINPPSLTIKYR